MLYAYFVYFTLMYGAAGVLTKIEEQSRDLNQLYAIMLSALPSLYSKSDPILN